MYIRLLFEKFAANCATKSNPLYSLTIDMQLIV